MQWNQIFKNMKRPSASVVNTVILVIMAGLIGYFVYSTIHGKPIVVNPAPSSDIEAMRLKTDSMQNDLNNLINSVNHYNAQQKKLWEKQFQDIKNLQNEFNQADSIEPIDDSFLLLESVRRISSINPPDIQSE